MHWADHAVVGGVQEKRDPRGLVGAELRVKGESEGVGERAGLCAGTSENEGGTGNGEVE